MKKRLLSLIRILPIAVFLLASVSASGQTANSVLSEGQFYKVAIATPGIYKLDATFLSNTAGIDLNSVASDKITLWTNGGGMLPRQADAPRIDDLREVAMLGVGTQDGSVDQGDYFLFYGEGPDKWVYNEEEERFDFTRNIYDKRNYYFICVSNRTAASMADRAPGDDPEILLTTYDHYQSHEVDKLNLLGRYRPPGSGQRWFGDEFSTTRERTYEITVPDIISGAPVNWNIEFAGRSDVTTIVSAEFNGNKTSKTIGSVLTGEVEAEYARIVRLTGEYAATDPVQTIRISYPQGASVSSGWLDCIEIQTKSNIHYNGNPLFFRSVDALDKAAGFVVKGMGPSTRIWNITDRQRPLNQQFELNGDEGRFTVIPSDSISEFIVFEPMAQFNTPEGVGAVANQNIHGITDADLVIIYHRDFEQAASRLADHRLEHDGYLVEMIEIGDLMNEFGGGGQDVTAIRDFARMLHQRSERFRFLLLFGDGSYDARHLNTEQNDDNFIPAFETTESMRPIYAFPTDDYFALLSDGEGLNLRGAIDIAVGRIPVRTTEEANQVVEKLIYYDTSPATFGDWRLGITYVADDEDGNQHLNQTEGIATEQIGDFPDYNVRKVYLDAYQQVITPGGQRYPAVNDAINTAMERGNVIMNYLGHGGPAGWSQERVLGNQDIQSWSNINKLPVLITATCSFAPYDEPSLRSAGELVLLNPVGGAVALLTTVRAVYASSNARLVGEVFERILLSDIGATMTLGEVMLLSKNSNHTDTVDVNARKFALLGDPSMKLAMPEHDIVITNVNGAPVGATPDTASALEQVEMKGEIRATSGEKLSSFNGQLTVTVYDKMTRLKTLANDPGSSEREYEAQLKVLFKGNVSVMNGDFQISFVVPQDIDFTYGKGKVSMYATDGFTDAGGHFSDFIIGGGNTGSPDDQGPEIELAVDYWGFESGGETGTNPTILIDLRDDSGINISGNSIGHDLEGRLDGDSRMTFILNDYYVATIDDHTSGTVSLPLRGIEPGLHTFSVVAWDIANNYSEASIDFRVVDNPENVVRNLFSSPNPFSTETVFTFDHQLGDVPMDVEIEVFSTTGALVRNLEWRNVISQNGRVADLSWTNPDNYEGSVVPGAYMYRVLITSYPGTAQQKLHESKFGKLIVVN